MAVEIRELHIKAVVGSGKQSQVGATKEAKLSNEQERESLVALCVERVMEILERQKER